MENIATVESKPSGLSSEPKIAEETEAEDRAEGCDWFGEIEFRRYLRDKIPWEESDRKFVPTEPDPRRAGYTIKEDYIPREKHGKDRPLVKSIDIDPPDGVEVYTDKIVVPLETVEDVEDLETWVKRNVLDGMFVRTRSPNDERPERGNVVLGTVSDDYGRFNYIDRTSGKENEIVVEGHATNSKRTGQKDTAIRMVSDPRPVYVQVPPGHELNELDGLWERRRREGRDMKMIITARDAATGTGKTTLAVALAKSWDSNGWDSSKATLSPSEYVSRYTELESGEILIGDEMEQMADPRRSMSKQNVTLTQYWSTMRQWEVSTIATLPSAAMVDKRLRELMDVRINVLERGVAVAYEKKIGDHSGEIREKRIHRIRWDALDDDPDYRELARMKKEHMENFNETAYFLAEEEEEESKTPEEAKRDFRNETIREMAEADYSQKEIASIFDLSRPRISQILNEGDDE